MKTKRTAELLLLSFVVFAGLFAPMTGSHATSWYTKKQVLEDLDRTEKLLRRYHPNLYAHRKNKELKRRFKSIRNNVRTEETYLGALLHIQRMLAAVCDEHTSVHLHSVLNQIIWRQKPFLNADLLISGKKLFSAKDLRRGITEPLAKIGKHDAEKIAVSLADITNADGCMQGQTFNIKHTNTFGQMLLRHKNRNLPSVDYSVTKKDGSTDVAGKFYPISVGSYFSQLRTGLQAGRTEQLRRMGIDVREFEFGTTTSTGHFQTIIRANSNKSAWYIRVPTMIGDKNWKDNLNRELRDMIASQPDLVILDLTENVGGRIANASYLASYFLTSSHKVASQIRIRTLRPPSKDGLKWDASEAKTSYRNTRRQFRRALRRKRLRPLRIRSKAWGNPSYNGRLIVLVSSGTHSAATMLAHVLKRKRKLTLVGHQAGGSSRTTCYAPRGHFTLKNTEIPILIPFACVDRRQGKSKKDGRLAIDIKVDPLNIGADRQIPAIFKAAIDSVLGEE